MKRRYLLGLVYLFVLILCGVYYFLNQNLTKKELENISRNYVVSIADMLTEIFSSHFPDSEKIEDIFFSLTQEGEFDYVALLKGEEVIFWESRYEGFLPIRRDKGEDIRIVNTPLHRIMEFKRNINDSLSLVGGYSLAYLDELERRTAKNFMFIIASLLVVGLISLYLVMLLERKIVEGEVALREEETKRKHFEELSALSSTVAHEIKNPLNTLALVLERVKDKGMEEKYFELMEKEIERMNRIVNEFRNVAKPLVPEVKETALSEIVERAVNSVKKELVKPGIEVLFRFPPDFRLKCDPELFTQLFYNLIKNAFESIEEKGKVEICAERTGKKIKIEVKDTGKGMDKETLKKVFDFFFTTKSRGLGIGLGISKRIVEAHGGKMEILSEPGKGTIIRIEMEERDV